MYNSLIAEILFFISKYSAHQDKDLEVNTIYQSIIVSQSHKYHTNITITHRDRSRGHR